MAITHTPKITRSGSGTITLSAATISGTNEINVPELVLAASTTNQALAIAFAAGSIKSVFISVTAAAVLKTNSTSSPGNTFNLSPAAPFMWFKDSGINNPFTSDVTITYLTTSLANVITINILLA